MIISVIAYFEYKNRSSSVFMRATIALLFGITHFITTAFGSDQFSNYVLNQASIFAVCFSIIYLVSRIIIIGIRGNKKLFTLNHNNIEFNERLIKYLFYLFFIISIIKIFSFIKFSGGLLESSWGKYREYGLSRDYVNSQSVIDILYYSLSGILFLSYFGRDKFKFIIIFFIMFINSIIFRHRIAVLPIICSFIFIYLTNLNYLTPKKILGIIIIGIMIIYIIYGLRVIRYYGTFENFIVNFNFKDFNYKIMQFLISKDGELALKDVFYYFISRNNEFNGFGQGSTYLRMVLVLVPTRFSFGLKPEDFAITMGAAIGMRPGGSFHPTLFGDVFANFGFYGVFLGIFWAVYVSIFDKLITTRENDVWKSLHFILNSMFYVIIARGSVYNAFFFTVYGTIALIIMEIISNHFKIIDVRGKNRLVYIKRGKYEK